MARKLMSVEEILELLAETPSRIAGVAGGLSQAQLRARPGEVEWSVSEVFAHLRSCADMWGDRRIMVMIREDHPTIRAINPRTWIKQTEYLDLEFQPSFKAFAGQRANLLADLEPLPPEGWTRSATVTGAGRPFEQTVWKYADGLARHERAHIKQIARIVESVKD